MTIQAELVEEALAGSNPAPRFASAWVPTRSNERSDKARA